MRFPLVSSRLSSTIKAAVASAFALTIFAACSDNFSAPIQPDVPADAGTYVVETQVPDSVKNPVLAPSGSMLRAPGSAAMLVSPSNAAFAYLAGVGYSVSSVPFAPEAPPTASFGPNCDDCVMFRVPLGFEFMFYGAVYTSLNISSNGFVGFGTSLGNGCCKGGAVPSPDQTNNIIALGWSDWQPQLNPGSIRYETRGQAPNRRFVLQFTNVKEFGSTGRLTVQLVLAEELNEITIYTPSMATNRSDHLVTQAIENLPGTDGLAVAGRVRNFFKLTEDAVRFTPTPNQRPALTIPADISVGLAIGSCSANVDPGTASATDDTDGFTILPPVRSDALAINAPYPGGVTTIAWTVRDIGGLKTTSNQTITVRDEESPSITAPASVSADNDPGMGSAVVATGNPVAADNCEPVTVGGTRSDGAAMSAPFPVGTTTINWVASDKAGNSASATQSVLVRDVESPSINALDMTLDATSPSGAVVHFLMSSSDNVGVTQISCTRESGSVFPAGSTSVTCTARDAAGNSASTSFVVRVRGAAEQILAVIGDLTDMPLSNGDSNPILNQLRAALAAVEDEGLGEVSCKKLNDFIRMLTTKKGSDLSPDQVAALLLDVRRIMSVLGCQ